ncbi:ATP-binding protein [Streptomyces sp. DSM 41634]|uniref:ATP-binding protein n=1 Tax=Streptomyces sp. DSM 41634 TaxID=3448656 RepID=UPI0040400688
MNTTGAATGDPRREGVPVTGQCRRLALRSVRGAVAKGRDFTRRTLRDWGWDRRESAEDALLVVSELVANAALHASGCHELVLTAGESLRIDVLDGARTLPRPRAARRPGVPGGHGLHIVQRLSDRWGSYAHGTGKVVWAEIESARLTTQRGSAVADRQQAPCTGPFAGQTRLHDTE